MKENNPIDDLFRDKLNDHEIEPREAVWEKITAGKTTRRNYSILRAAVITLLVGLSSVVYFHTNDLHERVNYTPGEVIKPVNPLSHNSNDDPVKKSQSKGEPGKPSKGTANDKPQPKRKEIQPIMKSTSGPGRIYVNHDIPEVNEEELFAAEEAAPLNEIELNVRHAKKEKVIPVRLKYRIPVTEKSFYASGAQNENPESEKPKMKERLFAYANNQLDNLINGEPVRLPRPVMRGKPQLEINLDEIFND